MFSGCTSNHCKRVLKAAKLAYNHKKIVHHFPETWLLGLGELRTVFSTKINLLYLLYSTVLTCCLLHLIKQSCFLKSFLKPLILMTRVSLYLFSLLKLCISVTPKMIKKVIPNLDSSKASDPDCIPVVFLKK